MRLHQGRCRVYRGALGLTSSLVETAMTNIESLSDLSPHRDDCLLTTKEAAKLLNVSTAFLERDRWAGSRHGKGAQIPYVKVGARAVRYRLVDLVTHIRANVKP